MSCSAPFTIKTIPTVHLSVSTDAEFGALLGELLVAMLSCRSICKIHYRWSGRRRGRRLRPYP